jgi:hypothetical protein
MPRIFQVNVTVEHGQLREYLASETDRLEMIDRLQAILLDTTPGNTEMREGVIQILIDQLVNDNGHEPLIIRTGGVPGELEEQIEWVSEIVETPTKKREIKVTIDKYRNTVRTPRKPGRPDKPFTLPSNQGQTVHSGAQNDKSGSKDQKFYKFSIEAKDTLGNDLELDPCIICES